MVSSIASSKSPEAQRWSPAPPSTLLLSSSLPKSSSPKVLTDSDDICAQVIVLSRTRSASDGPLRAKLHLALVGAVVHINDDFGEFKIIGLKADDGSALDQCRINARTQLFIAYIKYNVVIAIDISSSMATASNRSVLFEDGIASVCRILEILYSLRAGFRSSLAISEPSILVSIVACDHANVVQAIVHNADLESIELSVLVDLFKSRFFVLESQLSSSVTNESSTINDAAFMIACTLLTHDRMPLGRCPLTFLVTDGVLSAPDIGTFDSVFASIAAKDITIHTVMIDTPTSYFGFVPDSDFLHMTAQYSGGMSLSSDEVFLDTEDCRERHFFFLLLPSAITRAISPNSAPSSRFCLKVKEYLVDVGVGALVACRIKEGFKNGRLVHLEPSGFAISLLLVWKPIITVEYTVEMRGQENLRVSLKVIAPDEFLRKLQIMQKSKKHRGPPVTINTGSTLASHPLLLLERLSMIVKTDQLLVLLHCIRPSDVMSQTAQPDDHQHVPIERHQGSSCLAKLISLPPNMWKRWMTAFSLDIVCQHSHPYDQLGAGSESLFEMILHKWCSSVHGKVFIKQLADNNDSIADLRLRSSYWRGGHRRPLPLCFARLFWITSGLAYLFIGFTTVDTFQIESELQLLKDLLQNCASMDRSQEPCVVFPFLPLSPVLLRLDPSDAFFRPDIALDDARASQIAFTASPLMSPTSLSRSVSTPDLQALSHMRMLNSAQKSSPTMRTDITRDAVEISLPKTVLRFFMRSCQRTYRIQNHRTLTAFFKRLNHTRISDGFRQICSDEFSCSYFTDIEIIADRRANLQFALCKLSETDIFVEIWLDPDEPCSVRLRSDSNSVAANSGDYFDNIVDWLDTYDCHCLQALQAFHAIVDSGMSSGIQAFCVKDGNSIFQYKSQARLSCSPMSRFSVRELQFDIVPLLHCARPCIVPLHFPTGMPANQASILSSLEHIHGLIPVLPEICYAQIISHSFITLVVLSPEAGSQAAKQAPALLRACIDSITGCSSDLSQNTATVVIFEVNITDIAQYRLPIKSPLTDLDRKFTPVFTPKPNCIEKRSCSHSSELNNLRQTIEQAHATNFVRTIYDNAIKGENVSEYDLRTALQSCAQFRDTIDLTEFAGVDDTSVFQHDLQWILHELFRPAAAGSPYFALMNGPLLEDAAMSDDNIDEDTSVDSNNLLPTPQNSPVTDITNLPFFCLFEIVTKQYTGNFDTVSSVILPVNLTSAFLSNSSQISLRLTAFMLPSKQISDMPAHISNESKSRIRKSISLSSFPRSPTLRSAMSRCNAPIPEIYRFSALPDPLRKCMARVSKLIRSAFCKQMLRCLYTQLPRPLSEKEATTVIRYLDYLRPPLKHQAIVELDFIQCAGVTRSPRAMLLKLLQESLTLQAVSDSCFLIAVDSFAFLSVSNNNINIVVDGDADVLLSLEKVTQNCLHRVSQLMLLESLHVTRIASDLLISDGDAKFACPRLFTEELKLHPRLNPSAALQALNDTTLHPFVLGNRHFVYVYQQSNGAIYYMRLVLNNAALFLEFYGVEQPDADTCTHLSNLLRTSVSALALAQIAALLSRNQHFPWTQSDLLLIRPEGSAPKAAFRFELPFAVCRKTFNFLLRMAQTFASSSLLSALRCADPILHSERLHWSWSDFSFVYNYDAQFSSSKLVDNGIALVFGSLISTNGDSFRLHRCCIDDSDDSDLECDAMSAFSKPIHIAVVPGGISRMQYVAEAHQPPEEESSLSIAFEIWALGSVDIHQLISDISRLFSHTAHDFLLESLWKSSSSVNIQKFEVLKNLAQATHSDQNPALHLTDVSFRLASWSLAVIVADLQAMTTSIHENVQVSVFICDSGCWHLADWHRNENFRISQARLFADVAKLPSLQYHPHVFASDVPFTNPHVSKNSVLVERVAFVLVDISRTHMQIIAYNLRTSLALQLVKQSLKLASWCRFRLHLLDHILHQKLGLFKHLSSTSPPPITSTNEVAVNPAKFTVENIEVLIGNKAPPRHAIQESLQIVPDQRHSASSLADRRRTLNRFETVRRRFHSVRTATTVLSPGSTTPSAFPFATLLRGQSPPDEYIGYSKREMIVDPLCRHGRSYLLIRKRIRDEKEAELQKKFCLEICESGVAASAPISSQLQWIDLICTHSIPLSRPPYYSHPSFLFCCGSNADFIVAAVDIYVGEFALHLSQFDCHPFIIVKQDCDGGVLHRCLFRKVFDSGLIFFIHFSVRPSKISCDGYLYESINGAASVDQINAASVFFNQNIDATTFTLRFHVSYLFALLNQDRPQSTSSQSSLENIELRSTFAFLSEFPASGLCCESLPSHDADSFNYLLSNANRFGYWTSSSYVFSKEFIAFSFEEVFVLEALRDSTLTTLEAFATDCISELSRQRLWKTLKLRSSDSTISVTEDDLSLLGAIELDNADPALSRLFQCLGKTDSVSLLEHIRQTFPNICSDLTFCIDSKMGLFIGRGDVGVIVAPQRVVPLISCSVGNNVAHERKALYADVVNAACMFLWRRVILE